MEEGSPTLSAEMLGLTWTALDEFESLPLDGSARRALRIAQLRGDSSEAWLLRSDLRPFGGANELRVIEIAALFKDSEYADIAAADKSLREVWIAERSVEMPDSMKGVMPPDKEVIVGSIADLIEQKRYFESEAQKVKTTRLVLLRRSAPDCHLRLLSVYVSESIRIFAASRAS